ncbi:MAG: PAS domain S-box protein [Anaerolineales bacterium]|nr:PAS domain S-box protein [Anaerolineales bacterium]MDW8277482.1 PAS domain S-box protein [Anaerolineales bacterium]
MSFSLLVILLFVSSAFSLVLALYIFTRRRAPGSAALGALALLIAEWSAAYGLEIAMPDFSAKYFWAQMQYIGIAFVPFSWLLFAVSYTRQENLLRRLLYVHLLGIFPLITVLLTFTNDWHHLIWSETFLKQIGPITVLGTRHTGWFWVHFAVSYLFLLSGTLLILRNLRRMKGLYRAQILALFFAVLLPWVANVIYFVTPIGIDPTPFAFNITLILLVWAIFGYRLTDIAPIARDLVVDNMREGLLVLDLQGRIVDVNASAAQFIGLHSAQILGQPAAEILKPWQTLLEQFRDVFEFNDVIEIGSGEAVRQLNVRVNALRDERGNLLGRLVSFQESGGELPRRFVSRPLEPLTQPLPPLEQPAMSAPETGMVNPVWRVIRDFFVPPVLPIQQTPNENSFWYQTIERTVTVILRILAVIGLTAVLFYDSQAIFQSPVVLIIFFVAVAMLWVLGLARQLDFGVRIWFLGAVLYTISLNELLNYGYSAEAFALLITFVSILALLGGTRGALGGIVLAVITLAVLGVLINIGGFRPFSMPAGKNVLPDTLISAFVSIVVFAGAAGGIVSAILVLINRLNYSLQQETQARALLKQERDLLEQRVRERTAELREARDLALQNRNELRTYYQAIEQSGNSIVITDAQGKIEYVNPFFERITGYSIQEVLGKNSNILGSGHQSKEFYRRLWKTISNGEIWQGEFLNKRKDGSLYWEYATIAPVKDEQGKIRHYVAIKEDITAQKELRETLARQNEYLAALQNITLELLDRRDRQELLDNILQRARDALGASLGAIALWENGQLVFRAVARDRQDLYGKPVLRETMPLVWQAFEKRRPVVVDDYAEKYGTYQAGSQTLHAVADFPIISGRQVLGVIALGRSESALPFNASQVEFGQSLAQIAALVLDNANLYDSALRELEERKRIQAELEISEKEQRALTSILQIGMREDTLEDILLAALDDLLAIPWLGLEAKGGIFLKDVQTDTLILTADRNLSTQIRSLCKQVALGKCHCGRAALTRQLQFSSHVDHLHEITYEGIPDHGHYNVPILSGETVLGVIVLYLPPGYEYNERDVRFLQAFAGTLSNIIRRKRTEELLRESEMRFRQIVENASDIIYRMDSEGRMVYVNPVGLRLMGYAEESEVVGRYFTDFAAPDWRNRVKAFYKKQVITGQPATYYEFQAITKEGRVIWLGQNVQMIRQADGKISFQAVARDITELKETQKALEEARDQALEASRFKSQLVSRVSHELRTPLGGVLGYAELMYQGAFGPLTDEQKDAAENIVASANYLNQMINELLDQAQIEARAVKIHLAPFEPAILLRSVQANMTVLALNKGLQFVAELDPSLPSSLLGDERRLQQVLINLAGNAIKFTQEGHVHVSLLRLNDSEWAMRVSDTGAGIPKEAQEYIFDAFRQVDNAITRNNRGTGLGLSITKQLVELMGGRIQLESEVGRGSTFTVILPLQVP